MRATDVMVRDIVTVHSDSNVADAIKLMSEHNVSALPVAARLVVGRMDQHDERKALLALVEGIPGVSRVSDEMIPAY